MSKPNWPNKLFAPNFVWIGAIVLRIFGFLVPAQNYDMSTFEAWSRAWWQYGPTHFFSSVWSDYLPLPILSFAPLAPLSTWLHLPFEIVFKVVHSLLEIALITLIPGLSLVARSILLFLPPLIGDTAYWGQVDAIPALLGVLAIAYLITRSPKIWPALFLGLAVAYKPIMVLVAPIAWIISLKRGWRFWELPLFSALICLVTAIPTGGLSAVTHLWSRVFDQAGTYPYLTVNAFNLYSLVPNLAWIPDQASVLSISGNQLGLILFGASVIRLLLVWRAHAWQPKYAWRIAATVLIAFYTFTTRMHERHLLFGLPFLALAATQEPFLFLPLSALSATFLLNLYGAYYWVFHSQSWPFSTDIISLASWVNVLTTLGLVFIWDWRTAWTRCTKWCLGNRRLVLILLLASLLRLGNLAHPQAYIFDEVYHAFTAKEYLHNHIEAWEWWTTPPEGVAYEWTHPPLAKYGMVLGMLLFGENTFGYRVGSAILGVLSIYGVYLLVKSTTKSSRVALLAAFLLTIEGTHIAQSRVAMNDMYMLASLIYALLAAVKSRWKTAAVLYGLALASKWSALYGVVPLAYIYLRNPVHPFLNLKSYFLNLISIFRLLLIAVATYILTFAPFILAGHTWAQWWELHRQMWYYHTHLVATHAYQSTPQEWLFDLRPVWYWVEYGAGKISNIYVIGNPLVLWLGLASCILLLPKILTYPYTLYFILYTIFTFPWFFSPRIMFYYHYLPSATFLTVILALWIARLSPRLRLIMLGCCLVGLLAIVPMLYGLPFSTAFWDTYFKLMPTWK